MPKNEFGIFIKKLQKFQNLLPPVAGGSMSVLFSTVLHDKRTQTA